MNRKSRMKSTLDSLFSTNSNQAENPKIIEPTLSQENEAKKQREKVETEKKPITGKEKTPALIETKPVDTKKAGAASVVKPAEKKPAVVSVKKEKATVSETQPEAVIPQTPPAFSESQVEVPQVAAQSEKSMVEHTMPIAPTAVDTRPEIQTSDRTEINNEKHSRNNSDEKVVSDEEEHLVVFLLGDEAFGIEIHSVESIIKKQLITKVPHAEKFILGVTNLRGTVVPVVDLRQRFALPIREATKDTRIIVLNTESGKDGILVDEVSEVMRIPKSSISPTPMITSTVNSTFIKGVARTDDKLIILLDVNTILS